MSISSIGSTQQTQATGAVQRMSSRPPPPTEVASASAGADSAKISKRGQLFGRLSELAQSDPAKFKEAATEIAKELKDAAASATDGSSQALTDLAAKFDQAAQSGNMSALQPKKSGHHGHHHHGQVQGASSGATGASPPGASTVESIVSSVLDKLTSTAT